MDDAICSETRLSIDTEMGFWVVGRGKRLIGDPDDEAFVLESCPVKVL